MGRRTVVQVLAFGALVSLSGCGLEGSATSDALQDDETPVEQQPANEEPADQAPPSPLLSCPAQTPANLKPPAEQALAFVYHAVGAQVYECKIPTGSAAFKWVLVEPRATLYNAKGENVGSHSAGPTWSHKDGSAITGVKRQEAPGATANDIPWLLLATTPKPGAATGKFTDVTWIQRLSTSGGVAPPEPCDQTASADAITSVPYEADYFFYRRDEANAGNNDQCG